MTRKARGYAKGLAVLSLSVVGLLAAGCGAPPFTYVADSSASTYFKVPRDWHKIGDAPLAQAIGSNRARIQIWAVAYDAASAPAATHVLNLASQPVALAMVSPLNAAASNAMSYNELRDFLLPVTSGARQSAAQSGFRGSGFRLLRNTVLTPGHGVHGVRVTVDYTYPNGSTETFDKIALTNAIDTEMYVLLVHCSATCYRVHRGEINIVMTSFTVGIK